MNGGFVRVSSIAFLIQIGESISWQTGIIANRLITFVRVIRHDGGVALSSTDVIEGLSPH
jgi:hypothetical protein